MVRRVDKRSVFAALHMADVNNRTISLFAHVHPKTVHRWICRVEEGKPLTDLPRSGRPRIFSEAARLTTIAVYCQQAPPLPGVHRWSLRSAENHFKEHPDLIGGPISHATIQRILTEHALKPHRRKYYLQITDPDFFPKMEHIIDCYLHPPENLYCFDECTCIQALKRLCPNLPVAPDQPALEEFEYVRNGTTDLLAFLNPATGQVYGQCTDNHASPTLCRVFSAHVQMHPPDAVLHYIMDNLSTHFCDEFCQTVAKLSAVPYSPLGTGAQRRQWLQSEHKRIVIHFVPFHASWLNMVEIWFGILKSKCLNYDHFFSVDQLRKDILAFIDTWDAFFAHPFSWSYTGEGLHAKAVRRFCRLLAIQTDQMDCKFLTSQLLLMSNIAESYLHLVPPADWLQLLDLAAQSDAYFTRIIEADPGPLRKRNARAAYARFIQAVINRSEPLAEVG